MSERASGLVGTDLRAQPDPAAKPVPLVALPCVSLWQPYASLIRVGAKRFETRHWPAPARVLGRWVAVHAAVRRPTRAEVAALDPFVAPVLGGEGWAGRLPYGEVVCIALLTGSHAVELVDARGPVLDDGRAIEDDGFGDYSPGRYCWELSRVRGLSRPCPAKGAQGWFSWTVPEGVSSVA